MGQAVLAKGKVFCGGQAGLARGKVFCVGQAGLAKGKVFCVWQAGLAKGREDWGVREVSSLGTSSVRVGVLLDYNHKATCTGLEE